MQLPDHAVGITDLIAHRECPRRMSYGLRRHTGKAQQSDERTPEAGSYATAYGSAIHDAIQALEDGHDVERAIQVAWNRWGSWLEPGDVDLLREDLAIYLQRDFPGTRTIAAEDEFRIPLFVHDGQQVWFRFKLDRLYERLDAPGVFIHVDYKSSRHAKSENEVHGDLQMWAYNLGIHEFFPECEQLLQFYDQLRYGQVPTRKSGDQRRQIREFLIKEVTKVLEDDDVRDDGLHRPKKNQWCAWCPVMESCPVVEELTEFGLVEIAALAPQEKVGRKTVVQLVEDRVPEYVERLEDVKQAQGVLSRFEESVKRLVKEMPVERRAELGYELKERKASSFTPRAAAELHDRLGERFYELVKLTKSGLESNLAEDPALLEWALSLAEEQVGAAMLVRIATRS
jgi:hypothetical protein